MLNGVKNSSAETIQIFVLILRGEPIPYHSSTGPSQAVQWHCTTPVSL